MELNLEQVLGLVVLGSLAILGLAVLFLVVHAVRRVARWARGRRPAKAAKDVVLPASPISASDLYAARANLDAVSRQLADLELKLRLTAARAQ